MKKILEHKSLFVIIVAVSLLYGFTAWGPSLSWSSSFSNSLVASPLSVVQPQEEPASATSTIIKPPLFQYIEVMDGCGKHFEGACVNMRSGPGVDYPVILGLRTGVVLKVVDTVTQDGEKWYKIGFAGELHYPERVVGDLYVAADYVRLFEDEGVKELSVETYATTTKHIVVDLSEQTLYAYDGDNLFMKEPISAGLKDTPTPRGTFTVYRKTPSRYMQGPLPDVSDQYFDLPGVPWNLYFTYGGAVIHGAYWHDNFGKPWSHGCVNLSPQNAKKLYEWAIVGIPVVVRN